MRLFYTLIGVDIYSEEATAQYKDIMGLYD